MSTPVTWLDMFLFGIALGITGQFAYDLPQTAITGWSLAGWSAWQGLLGPYLKLNRRP